MVYSRLKSLSYYAMFGNKSITFVDFIYKSAFILLEDDEFFLTIQKFDLIWNYK